MDQYEISTMASKCPSKHWKTVDWKTSGQLKTLEKKQADLLELFSRPVTKLEGYLTQNTTMTAESSYRGFFQTYDNLEANRKQQRLLLKPKYLKAFDSDNKRMLEGKSKVLRSVVDKVPFLRDIEGFRTTEQTNLENKLKTKISSDSEKQTLCNQVERLVETRD